MTVNHRKKISAAEIERRLIADAHDPNAWEPVTTVLATRSPRPSWYKGRSRLAEDSQFQSLYTAYYRRLAQFFIRAFHASPEKASELAQDTFIRVFRAMQAYRGDATWAFLETTARHVIFNKMRAQRAQKRHQRTEEIVDIDEARLKLGRPEEQEQAFRLKELHDAITELPAGQRQCLQLWLDGFKYSEISSALGISVDAVKSRLRDARGHLRSRLDSAEIAPIRRRSS